MRADQYEAMAREFPAVRHDQTLLTLQPTGCARDLEQLPVIREKRAREHRILYGHAKAKRKASTTLDLGC